MALHPQARASIEAAAGTVQTFEPGFDIASDRERARAEAAAADREAVAAVQEVDAGGVPARLYTPDAVEPGVVVHVHGGGFVFHDIDVHDALARQLANRSRLRVLSVDYRRAPEARFPAAVEDVDAALDWLGEQPHLAGPLLLHGDSAGGNLALVAALRRPERVTALALVYPFLDPTASFDSYRTHTDGFDPREAAWYWQQYAAEPAAREHPDLAPLRSSRLGELPPTLVVTAEHDPLRDEGEELVRRLGEAGVRVAGFRCIGQVHGYYRDPDYDAAEPTLLAVAAYLAAAAGAERVGSRLLGAR
jgi:acetyl esterase